jgi:carboxyl-terminal processing protease
MKSKKILFTSTFILTFVAGYLFGTKNAVFDYVEGTTGNVEITKVINLYQKTRSEKVDFEQFWSIWKQIKKQHINKDITDVDLFYGAIEGLVTGTNDPHSLYFAPKKAEEFSESLSGKFEGIGAEIGLRDGKLSVVAPLKGSPAEAAGLMAGDFIVSIDDKETYGMSIDEAVNIIRGEGGTNVILSILREEETSLRDITITRKTINIPTVALEMKDDNIAYIRLSYFNQETVKEFSEVVEEIIEKNPMGIVLDMRMNPGGYLDAAIAVASEWVEDGVIVKEVFKDGKEKLHYTIGKHKLAHIPTTVLVDNGTASGSEIVAGALQDYGKAQVIGMQTYGKGSVQSFEVFNDGSALKLTIAEWLTPKERHINDIGIEPNIILEEMVEDIGEGEYKDLGYEKAIELLGNK